MDPHMGKLKAIEKFDGAFFGIMPQIGDTIDPQARILLETTYEAICDAGIYLRYSSFKLLNKKIFFKTF
jgi:acyl transferase domain-containing protein